MSLALPKRGIAGKFLYGREISAVARYTHPQLRDERRKQEEQKMKKHVKIWAALLGLALLAGQLAACGGEGRNEALSAATGPVGDSAAVLAADPQDEPADNNEKTEIDFWDMVWGNDQYSAVSAELVARFSEQSGAIHVNVQHVPWDNWYQSFTTAIASGTGPDISTGSGYQAFQFTKTGHIDPLDDLVEELRAAGELDDFVPDSVDSLIYDGHYVALPWQIDNRQLWYNKNLLAEHNVEPPTTWEEFREVCRAVSGDGVYGLVISRDDLGKQLCLSFIMNNDGGLFDKDRNVDAMSKESLEAITFLTDMATEGLVDPAGAGMTANEAKRAFESGKVAFFFDTANYGVRETTPDFAEICHPLESFSGKKGTYGAVNNIMVYKGDHTDEAKEFLKWWSKNLLELWTLGGADGTPARLSTCADPYFADPRMQIAMNEWIPLGKNIAYKYPTMWPECNEVDGDVALTDMAQGVTMGVDPEENLAKVQEALEAIQANAS
jgi:multiple sugar transport system substrate-binding protein